MKLTNLTIKITNIFEPLFKKIKGGYFGILSTIIGGLTVLIASILFYLAEPFTFTSHWVSNLGGIRTNSGAIPNGANIVFSIGFICLAILSVPFVVYIARLMLMGNQKLPWLVSIYLIFGILSFVGLVGVSIFDMKGQPEMHVYAATLFFFTITFTILFISICMFLNRDIHKLQAIFSLFVAGIAAIFLLTYLPYAMNGEDIVKLALSTGPEMGTTRFWEWMSFFALLAWFFESGLYFLQYE